MVLKQHHHLVQDVTSVTQAAHPALVLTKVCKTYGQRLAVDQVTLDVKPGEIFGLLGPNGSGKTTTINLISGLLIPSAGTIYVLGLDVSRQKNLRQLRQNLGAVPQETALYEELTARDNLAFHADLYGVPRGQKPQRIQQMLELVGLLDRQDGRVKTFSGGMKRRLAIARALLHDPQLLYLDEPTLGVDVQSRRAIWDYILALREQGKTVLITTNYLEEAQALCDRLAILDHGRLVALDTPTHLKQRYGARVIELELDHPISSLKALRALAGVTRVQQQRSHLTITTQGTREMLPQIIALISEVCAITGIEVHEPRLDEIFLRLTGTALRD
jgi:daunorubicin resistance ABC transporter ATP-binding subunit